MSEQRQGNGSCRGYYGIGIENALKEVNVGTLWRSAGCFNANFIYTIGAQYHYQCSDTAKTFRHLPYWRFRDFEDFYDHMPYDCRLVGIEITPEAVLLPEFEHPERAVYLLGSEGNGLSKVALERCHYLVRIPSLLCLNVAAAGTVVLYDRLAKTGPRALERRTP
jgi:tRNA G18 (ribose-2'-O)-methylase SpoU